MRDFYGKIKIEEKELFLISINFSLVAIFCNNLNRKKISFHSIYLNY